MSWFNRHIGLDAFDVIVHATVTMLFLGFIETTVRGPDSESLMFVVTGGSVMLLAIRRWFALRRRGDSPVGLTTDQMGAARLEDLEERVSQLENAEARIAELEERLDFTERLLAEARGDVRAAVGSGSPPPPDGRLVRGS